MIILQLITVHFQRSLNFDSDANHYNNDWCGKDDRPTDDKVV